MTSPPAVARTAPRITTPSTGSAYVPPTTAATAAPPTRTPMSFPAPTGPPTTPDEASRAAPLTSTSRYSPHGGQDVAGSHLPDRSDMLEARVTQQRDMAGQGEIVALAAGAPAVVPS